MQISSIGQTIVPTEGFEALFCELYTKQRSILYKYILGIVSRQDVAEDICQDVFAKLWQGREKYAVAVEDHSAFLFRMAHNEAISYLRREKQSQQVFKTVSGQINSLHFTEEIIYQRELLVLLQKAIQSLSPERKKVYLLCKMEGLAYNAAAKLLGKSVCTVREMMRVASIDVRKYINTHTGSKIESKTIGQKAVVRKRDFVKVKALKAA